MDVLQDNFYLGGIWLDYQGMDHEKMTRTIRESLAMAHNFKADDCALSSSSTPRNNSRNSISSPWA